MLDISKYERFANDEKLVRRLAFLELEWRRNCPDVNLEEQLAWAHYWLVTNEKSYTAMGRFLSNWFRNEQKIIANNGNKPVKYTLPRFKENRPAEEDLLTGEDFQRMKAAIKS